MATVLLEVTCLDWASSLFSWIPHWTRFILPVNIQVTTPFASTLVYCTKRADQGLEILITQNFRTWNLRILPIWCLFPQLRQGSSHGSCQPVPWKIWKKLKREWRLKLSSPKTEILCQVYDSPIYPNQYSFSWPIPVLLKNEEYQRRGGLKYSRTLWSSLDYKYFLVSPVSCL